ncbi:hypothetical protein SAMN05720766_105145 [Fibrobacter sp. UWH9]|nr:hypothetical protein SAMN05720766_105145 [Fibrobacter sp. UWH9]
MKLALVSFTISLILFWTVNIPLFLFGSILSATHFCKLPHNQFIITENIY